MSKHLAEWHVFLDDQSEYNSQNHTWEDVPRFGILYLVLIYDDGTCHNWAGSDLYWMSPDGIIANTNDREALIRQYLPWVKFGVMVSDDQFEDVAKKARQKVEKWRADHGN